MNSEQKMMFIPSAPLTPNRLLQAFSGFRLAIIFSLFKPSKRRNSTDFYFEKRNFVNREKWQKLQNRFLVCRKRIKVFKIFD
jgi:hypothetical protein